MLADAPQQTGDKTESEEAVKEITFTTDDKIKAIAAAASYIDSLTDGKTYVLTIKEHKRRRSLDANAYAWVLLSKLAERLHEPKTDIYRRYIPEIGSNSETVCVQDQAVDRLTEGWEHNGIGWQAETMPSKLPGCTNVILYYGSSTYDTAQMSRLIDLIVQDCNALGIETKDPAEIDRLVEEWGLE